MNSVVFVILSLILGGAALLAVAYPILMKGRAAQPAAVSAQERLEELLAQRDAAYQALRELSFDHRVGKITGEDLVVFEANLKHVAADTLRALDEFERAADADLDAYLERTVAARKAALSAGGRACPQCGQPAAADDRFCARCGAELSAAGPAAESAGAVCPHCGKPLAAGDRFCAACGKPVAEAAPAAVR
ncbi:MAG: Double zinc ribbon [Chloroflexi bacterium ADurb.Bin325]|nr:MAG: Double zinc ribbon [Chloroflexi bacterium ADurb.Bin325]